jgi:hypothetical protein
MYSTKIDLSLYYHLYSSVGSMISPLKTIFAMMMIAMSNAQVDNTNNTDIITNTTYNINNVSNSTVINNTIHVYDRKIITGHEKTDAIFWTLVGIGGFIVVIICVLVCICCCCVSCWCYYR